MQCNVVMQCNAVIQSKVKQFNLIQSYAINLQILTFNFQFLNLQNFNQTQIINKQTLNKKQQQQLMNQLYADPLRFLKPRKRQTQLTPKKTCNTDDANKFNDNQLRQSKQTVKTIKPRQQINNKNCLDDDVDVDVGIGVSVNVGKGVISRQSQMLIQKKQTLNNNNNYNSKNNAKNPQHSYAQNKNNEKSVCYKFKPLKYFSKQIEQHLQKLSLQTNYQNTYQNCKLKNDGHTTISPNFWKQQKQQKQKQANFVPIFADDSFRLQQNLIIPLSKLNDHNDTLNLQDYFSSSKETPRNLKQTKGVHQKHPFLVMESPIQLKAKQFTQFEQKSKKSTNTNNNNKQERTEHHNKNIIFSHHQNDQDLNDIQEQESQLKECPTCHRKFNPNSYQKHVKVCQRVFFNKRKQFSSQKQRSTSKEKAKKK